MKISKSEWSKILRKVKSDYNKEGFKKLDSVTTSMYCCSSCHSAKMENEEKEKWVSLKYFPSGMNRRLNSMKFEDLDTLWFGYSLEFIEVNNFIRILKNYLPSGYSVDYVNSTSKCIEVTYENT